ncbi:ion channel [Marmoricola sp. RAF53]|uniref:ion channel n=1 Tax=Marmoricola sp. RAF53 TaxID=3233059 RepID=UPI003F943FCC
MGGVIRFVRQTPCAVLLAAQLGAVLIYPFLDNSFVGRQLFALFGLVVLALAIVAVRATPLLSWVAGLLAFPALVLLLIQVATADEDLAPWASGFESALYFYAAAAMLIYMLDDEHVTTDELFAIGAVFTVLAWAFAHLFVVVQALDPGAFTAAVNPTADRTWIEVLFLSFTTLSSTGLSDVVPITAHARSVVMIEQVAGLFYIAMVVTRLVALNSSRRGRDPT